MEMPVSICCRQVSTVSTQTGFCFLHCSLLTDYNQMCSTSASLVTNNY